MFETNWLNVVILTVIVFFAACKWQQKKDEAYLEKSKNHKLLSKSELAKEAGLATLLIIGGLLLTGIIRIEGTNQGCSYNRYEGPDACYDQY